MIVVVTEIKAIAAGICIGLVIPWVTHKIRGLEISPETQQVLNRLSAIEHLLNTLHDEEKIMSDSNNTLDQAVTDLDTAATNKITEDQTLLAAAQQGANEAADIAKVEGIADKLNAETATEQSELAAENPAPVTVTGATSTGAAVPDAPVDTSADAPTTQVIDTAQQN